MQINIEKRHALILLGAILLLAGAFVYAYGTSSPATVGHTAGEIEGIFGDGHLFYFGNFGAIFKDGASANANVQYATGSVCFITAYGQARINNGIIQTRAYTTGCSGNGNCDSGWVDASTATCSDTDGTVRGKSTATATKDGVTVNGYTGTATGFWA